MIVANEGALHPTCPETGLAVPECSCRRCLERMLLEARPALRAEEIRVRRLSEPGTATERRAA